MSTMSIWSTVALAALATCQCAARGGAFITHKCRTAPKRLAPFFSRNTSFALAAPLTAKVTRHLCLKTELESLRLLRDGQRGPRHRDRHRKELLLVRVIQHLLPLAPGGYQNFSTNRNTVKGHKRRRPLAAPRQHRRPPTQRPKHVGRLRRGRGFAPE